MKSLFKQMGGTYQEENGYLIPNPTSPAEKEVKPVGVGGEAARLMRYSSEQTNTLYQSADKRKVEPLSY